jgi:hypothetical protein
METTYTPQVHTPHTLQPADVLAVFMQAAHAAAAAGALHAFGEPVRAAAQEADLVVTGAGEE